MLWALGLWGRGEGLHLDPFALRRARRLRPRRVACEHCCPEGCHQPADRPRVGEAAHPPSVKLPRCKVALHHPPVAEPAPASQSAHDLANRHLCQPSSLLPLQN